jgi:hypothetical protein
MYQPKEFSAEQLQTIENLKRYPACRQVVEARVSLLDSIKSHRRAMETSKLKLAVIARALCQDPSTTQHQALLDEREALDAQYDLQSAELDGDLSWLELREKEIIEAVNDLMPGSGFRNFLEGEVFTTEEALKLQSIHGELNFTQQNCPHPNTLLDAAKANVLKTKRGF